MAKNTKEIDSIRDGFGYLSEIYASYPEIGQIEHHIKQFDKIDNPMPADVARIITKVSILLVRVGDLVSKLVAVSNDAYVYRKFRMVWEYRQASEHFTAKEKDAMSLTATLEEHKDELVKKYIADILKTKYESYERFISVQQSRLRVLEREAIRSQTQT